MSNNEPIPEELRRLISKIFSEPQDKIEIIRVILEIQNAELKRLNERIKKLEEKQGSKVMNRETND